MPEFGSKLNWVIICMKLLKILESLFVDFIMLTVLLKEQRNFKDIV